MALPSAALAFSTGRIPTAGAACAAESAKHAAHNGTTHSESLLILYSSNSKTGSRSRGLRSVTGCPQYAAGRRLHGERRQRGDVLILAVRRRAQFEGLRALALVRCARATRARAKKQAEESRPPPSACRVSHSEPGFGGRSLIPSIPSIPYVRRISRG